MNFSFVHIIVVQQIWLKELFHKKNSVKKIKSKITFTWKNASLKIALTENSGIVYVRNYFISWPSLIPILAWTVAVAVGRH